MPDAITNVADLWEQVKSNRSLEEVDFNTHGPLGGVQDFSGGSHWGCGHKRTSTRSAAGTWDRSEVLS